MAFTEQFAFTAGQTDLYAYPAGASYALSSTPWLAHRVLATEVVAGMYTVTMDESKSAVWSVFDGSAVPTSHDDAIATIRYEAPDTSVAAIKATTDKLDTAMQLDGSVYRFTANALELAPSSTGNTISGANTVTITVNYAGQPVQGAKVRMSRVGESGLTETNASGQVVFSADNGNWTVAITKPGFQFTPVTLVVDGNENQPYTLTAVSIPASTEPDTATGYLYSYDISNAPQSGAAHYVRMIAGPGVSGYSFDSPIRKVISDVNGLVAFTNLVQEATYIIWRGTSGQSNNAKTFTVHNSNANFALPEVL